MKILGIQPYDNFDVKFRLVICKDRKEITRARKKYIHKINGDDLEEACACFFPTAYNVSDDVTTLPGDFKSNVFGTMFINLDDLRKYGDNIIAHECAHAAFAFCHQVRHYKGVFPEDKSDEEFQANGEGSEQEVFCYFLENAIADVKQAINEYTKVNK